MTTTASVLDEVAAERKRQDEKWGGPAHDDIHDQHDWLDFINEHSMEAEGDYSPATPESYRKCLIEIAALAVAAAEAFDRNCK